MSIKNQKLIEAVSNGQLELAEALLQSGENPNDYEDCAQVTPLHFAVQNRSIAMIELLLQHGADPLHEETIFKLTPMDLAIEAGCLEIIDLFRANIKIRHHGGA